MNIRHMLRGPFSTLLAEIMEEPVIQSGVFEDDFYKFTMGQLTWLTPEYRDAEVTFSFTNRTKDIRLADMISRDSLEREFAHLHQHAHLNPTQQRYMRGIRIDGRPMFADAYINALGTKDLLPAIEVSESRHGQLTISSRGPWWQVTHVEIPVLRIVKALYMRKLLSDMNSLERHDYFAQGISRLRQTIVEIQHYPEVKISDFANRRSLSPWLRYVNHMLIETLGDSGQYLGTSCVDIAFQKTVTPMGTLAHERDMVIAAMTFDGSRESLAKAVRSNAEQWHEHYGPSLSIILPDTFGSRFALEVLPDKLLAEGRGLRQDSGDPVAQAHKYIQRLKKAGVDPRSKLFIPSDGLTTEKIIYIQNSLQGQIQLSYGFGTGLGSNFPDLVNPSIVMKATHVNGKPTVKLSNNIAKAVGPKELIRAYSKAADYQAVVDEAPTA